MRPRALALCFAAMSALPTTALAMPPDWDGERGFEFDLTLGYGAFGTGSDRVFLTASEVASSMARDAFSGSFSGQLGVGYRFTPYVSAGLSAGFQALSATNDFTPSEAMFGAHDGLTAYRFGVYGRFYLLRFLRRDVEQRRVALDALTDARRIDPWVSLGFDFVSGIQRNRGYNDPQASTAWSTTYFGAPIGVGLDLRVTASLAVGLRFTFSPLFGASTTKTRQMHNTGAGIDTVTRENTDYTPDASGNVQFIAGVAARYTLSF